MGLDSEGCGLMVWDIGNCSHGCEVGFLTRWIVRGVCVVERVSCGTRNSTQCWDQGFLGFDDDDSSLGVVGRRQRNPNDG